MSMPGYMLIRPPSGGGSHIRRSVNHTNADGTPFAAMMDQEKQHVAPEQPTRQYTAPAALPLSSKINPSLSLEAQRATSAARASIDLRRTQALNVMSQNFGTGGDSPFDAAFNMNTMRNLRSVFGGFSLRAPAMPVGGSIKGQALQQAMRRHSGAAAQKADDAPVAADKQPSVQDVELGKLAAQFESGRDGIAAIGYDKTGGTSYGKYQIASRVGSMDRFLKFLDTAAPDIAKSLRDSGPANTGSRKGGMPDMWRKIASEQPDRFEALQEKFIYDSHYKPALEGILAKTDLKESQISGTMQEVLWSTAVQHGPSGAVRIFSRAAKGLADKSGESFDSKLISSVYAIRAEQFGSSTEQVQKSVRNRMQQEKMLALNMLKNQNPVA